MNTKAAQRNDITNPERVVIDSEIETYIQYTNEFEKKMREYIDDPKLSEIPQFNARCPKFVKPILKKAYRILRWFVRKMHLRPLLSKTKLYSYLESTRILEKLGR